MLSEAHSRIKKRLESQLFALIRKLGPTYPMGAMEIEHYVKHSSSDFPTLFPKLTELSHYTDGPGLKGILETGSLWATNLAYLNDPEEFNFSYRRFEAMATAGESALDAVVQRPFLDGLRTQEMESEVRRTYVISFSARRDDLSQFRAYSDNGKGYCLEFEPAALLDSLVSNLGANVTCNLVLRQVQYGKNALDSYHREALAYLKESISQISETPGSELHNNVVRAFGTSFDCYLRETGVVFKQEGYKDEEEYRVVLTAGGQGRAVDPELSKRVSIRMRKGLPTPYIPIRFAAEPSPLDDTEGREGANALQQVIIGPGLDPVLARNGVFYLLLQNNFGSHTQIDKSSSTYRD